MKTPHDGIALDQGNLALHRVLIQAPIVVSTRPTPPQRGPEGLNRLLQLVWLLFAAAILVPAALKTEPSRSLREPHFDALQGKSPLGQPNAMREAPASASGHAAVENAMHRKGMSRWTS